jgi:hypothetical protein
VAAGVRVVLRVAERAALRALRALRVLRAQRAHGPAAHRTFPVAVVAAAHVAAADSRAAAAVPAR